MRDREERLLRSAFLVGAVTDAFALVPLLVPGVARLLWGIDASGGAFRFAAGYAAALMLGWTLLLAWAYRRPFERRAVAALTVVVVYGLVVAEGAAVARGDIAVWRMLPTWILQAVLIALFAGAFHYATLRRWLGAGAVRS